MLEKTEGITKNGQFRETCNIGHKTQNREKKITKENLEKKSHNTEKSKDEQHVWCKCLRRV